MAEELVMVDEDDNEIGSIDRNLAHTSNTMLHREILVLLFDNNNQILFHKRSAELKIIPGWWVMGCAGHVTSGETPIQTAQKELSEELGIKTKLVFIDKFVREVDFEKHWVHVFAGKYIDESIKVDHNEIEKIAFISRKDLFMLSLEGNKFEPISVTTANNFWQGKYDEQINQLEATEER